MQQAALVTALSVICHSSVGTTQRPCGLDEGCETKPVLIALWSPCARGQAWEVSGGTWHLLCLHSSGVYSNWKHTGSDDRKGFPMALKDWTLTDITLVAGLSK